MKFFGGLMRAPAPAPAVPAPVCADEGSGALCAPVSGWLVLLSEAPDPVFASGCMGPGCGIWPSDGIVYAPVAGRVSLVARTRHAVGIKAADGLEVLIHVGVDTVEMGGAGFASFVEAGDYVRAGQPLLSVDLRKIAAAGHADCVVMIVSGGAARESVSVVASGQVAAGDCVLMRQFP